VVAPVLEEKSSRMIPSSGSPRTTTDPLNFPLRAGQLPIRAYSWQRQNRIVTTLNAGTVHNAASLVSLDADGFTLNWTDRAASDVFFVLSLKGGSYKLGFGDYKLTTGTEPYTGVGFQPKGVMFVSDGSEWDES
jgi:hypothetical protein